MKIKLFLLLLPAAFAATLLSFCAKEPQITPDTLNNQGVVDRTKCEVGVSVTAGSVQVCGTGRMLTNCTVLPNGEQLKGVENIPSPLARVYGVQTADGPTNSGYLRITNTAAGASSVTVTTPTGVLNFTLVTPNQVRDVEITNGCVPQ
ncbi:MAG: hypothetical protein IT260_22150 [Saprospiraceae bacterium]|nr:hypothetical protein [Saprospiraceae bacterium]